MIPSIFLIKLTLLFLAGTLALRLTRSWPPALRHMLCVSTLASTLVLPFANALFPVPVPAGTPFVLQAQATKQVGRDSVPVLSTLWAVGTALMLLRYVAGLACLAQLTRKAQPFGSAGLDVRLAPVSTPLVWGWVRPTILLPLDAPAWTEQERQLTLLHELAHVRRRDPWTTLLVPAVQALYWFHPLAWHLTAALRREQELACDDEVLDSGAVAADYAAFLLATARKHPAAAVFGCGMTDHHNPRTLRGRIMRILHHRPAFQPLRRARVLAPLFAAALLAIASATPTIAESQDEVEKVDGEVSRPVLRSKVEPEYTEEARAARIEGAVVLSLVVGKEGVPYNIHVVRSLDAGLDLKAIQAVLQWRFQPAQKHGKPVAVRAQAEVNFRLL